MRILFITDFLSRSHFGREPLGVLYLVSALKRRGDDVDLVDISELKNSFAKIKKFTPQVIGYSIKTGYHRKFIDLNGRLKERFKFISVFGGPHATFYPDVIKEEGIDIVCRGEADNAIAELAANINRGDYAHTEGFWVKEGGKIYINPMSGLTEDLDNLAFPDRGILEKYPLFKNFGMRNFLSSRGCSFDCTYCHNYALRKLYEGKGRYIRRRSVNNLVEEIVYELKKNKLNFINFEDDIFVQDKSWLEDFSASYKEAVGLPFHCHVRADIIDEEKISLLKKAGCFSVSLGVETADESLRGEILNRNFSNRLILDVCSMLKSYRINIALQNMLGIPGTDLKSDLDTLRLNIKCGADYSITSMFTPYPGTKIADIYPFKDWDRIGDYYGCSAYPIQNKKERENLQKVFALLVKWPFLIKAAPLIINLPLSTAYGFIGLFWKYFWGRRKIFPAGFTLKYNLLYLKTYFFI